VLAWHALHSSTNRPRPDTPAAHRMAKPLASPDDLVEEPRESVAHDERERTARDLDAEEHGRERRLVHRPTHVERVVDDRQVGELDGGAAGRPLHLRQSEGLAEPQDELAARLSSAGSNSANELHSWSLAGR